MSQKIFLRILKNGLTYFINNSVLSAISVLFLSISLGMILFSIFFQAVLDYNLMQIKNKVDVTIYFKSGVPEIKIINFKKALEKLPEISEIKYISSSEALTQFKEKHKNDYLILQALEELGENPLGASLSIKTKNLSQYESVVKFLQGENVLTKEGLPIIEKINYHQNKEIIEKLNNIISFVRKTSFVVVFVLVFISILICLEVIRLSIFSLREEIKTMSLLGIPASYIKGSFVVHGFLIGFVSFLVVFFLSLPFSLWLSTHLTRFLGLNLFSFYLDNIFKIVLILFLTAIITSSFASFLAVNKYLKKFYS